MTKSFQLDSRDLRALQGTVLGLAVLLDVFTAFPMDYRDHALIAVCELLGILLMAAYAGWGLVVEKYSSKGILLSSLLGIALSMTVVLICHKDHAWVSVMLISMIQSQFFLWKNPK